MRGPLFLSFKTGTGTTDLPFTGHPIPQTFLTLVEDDPQPKGTTSQPNPVTRALHKALTTLSLVPALLRFLLANRRSAAHPRILSFMTALRASAGGGGPAAKIGVAGFCWGGLHAVLLTHDTPQNRVAVDGGVETCPLVDCAFTAHPSMLSFPGDIEGVVRPLSVANGDDDAWMGKAKMQRLVGMLEGKNAALGEGGGEGERYEAVVYPGAKHGFAVRGDLGDPLQRERGEQSEEQAVRWFRRWFGN